MKSSRMTFAFLVLCLAVANKPWAQGSPAHGGGAVPSAVEASGPQRIAAVRRARLDLSTGRIGPAEASDPIAGSSTCFANTDTSGFYYRNNVADQGDEFLDWGVIPPSSCEVITGFSFGYATRQLDVTAGGLGADLCVKFYDGVSGFCADSGATPVARFDFTGLPGASTGLPIGFGAGWIIDVDLTGVAEFFRPAGPFGYGIQGGGDDGSGVAQTGPILCFAGDGSGGPDSNGQIDAFDDYVPDLSGTCVGTLFFGGPPNDYSSWYVRLAAKPFRRVNKIMSGIAVPEKVKKNETLWYDHMVKTINKELGRSAQAIHLIFNASFSGGAHDSIKSIKEMTWSLATSTSTPKEESANWDSWLLRDNPNNKPGLDDTAALIIEHDGFGPQWIRFVRDGDGGVATLAMRKLFELAKRDNLFRKGDPNFCAPNAATKHTPKYDRSRKAADGMTFNSGTNGRHAILMVGDEGKEAFLDYHVRELNNRLRDANPYGYTNAQIQLLVVDGDADGPAADGYNATCWDPFSTANFETAVKNLEDDFDGGDTGKKQLTIYGTGTGHKEARQDAKQNNEAKGSSGQGAVRNAGDPSSFLTVDSSVWRGLFENLGVVGADEPQIVRSRPPILALRTFEEFGAMDQEVDLRIYAAVNGVPTILLAEIDLEGSSNPGAHEYLVSIPDSSLLSLAGTFGIDPPDPFELYFDFQGGAGDGIRFYTEDDYWLDVEPEVQGWGVGIGVTLVETQEDACVAPSATFRNDLFQTNVAGYDAPPIVVGDSWQPTVDNTTTGNAVATIVGYATALEFPLSFGVLLVNIADPGGELLAAPVLPGTGLVEFEFLVPSGNDLCGFTLSTQAVTFGGGVPVTLHNAYDFVIGR